MEKFEIVGIVDPEIEDSGMAMIAEISDESDNPFFVRLHSYEDPDDFQQKLNYREPTHNFMNAIKGKKVRVTVEVIED